MSTFDDPRFAPMLQDRQFAPTMDYYIPQWEERTSYGMRRIDPYTKLFEDRIIFLGTPISDEIANAVLFLASDASAFVTGVVLMIIWYFRDRRFWDERPSTAEQPIVRIDVTSGRGEGPRA